jgi:hypothetical protein
MERGSVGLAYLEPVEQCKLGDRTFFIHPISGKQHGQ